MAETGRRAAIDVARVLALFVVVLGHLMLAVVDRSPSGALRGANILELHPGWSWLAALAPMPVFFAAGGWANATTSLAAAIPRLRTLVGLGTVVVAVWSFAVLVAGGSSIVADGARVATQPLWFLAAYVPFAASGRRLARAAARHPVLFIGGCLLLVLVLDVCRFALSGPRWLGWPGFPAAWAVPWLAGAWWRSRCAAGAFRERRAGLFLVLGAGLLAAGLVLLFGYEPSLIDAVPGMRSNTTPPSLYTAVAGLAQAGLLMLGAGLLDQLGRRWHRFWDAAGEAAVAVYVWHLTALALCVAVVAAGWTRSWAADADLVADAAALVGGGPSGRRRPGGNDGGGAGAPAPAYRHGARRPRGDRRTRHRSGRRNRRPRRPPDPCPRSRLHRAVHNRLAAHAPAQRWGIGVLMRGQGPRRRPGKQL